MKGGRKPGGFTLIECLVVLAISSLIFIGIYSFYLWGVNTWQKGVRRMDNQQNARIAMDYLVDELRFAGKVEIRRPHEIRFWFKDDPGTYIFRRAGREIVFERINGHPSHNKIALGVTDLYFEEAPDNRILITITAGTGNEQVTLTSSIRPRNIGGDHR